MRQRTTWGFVHKYSNGRLRVGSVSNPGKRFRSPRDTVWVQWTFDDAPEIQFALRPDEALALASGLTWIVSEHQLGKVEKKIQDSGH
jgi:hypothetical protein